MTEGKENSTQFIFSCPLASGLHARPASHLAEVTNRFACECTLTNLRNGLVANCKSVLGVIAADIRAGDRCSVCISGPQAPAATAALRRFVEDVLPGCDVPLATLDTSTQSNTPPRTLRQAHVACVFGTSLSRGIGQGKIVTLSRIAIPRDIDTQAPSDIQVELGKIKYALEAVRERICEKLKYCLTPAGTAVLQAERAMAGDVFLRQKLEDEVRQGRSAPRAVIQAAEFFIDLLGHSENEYVRQRAADIEEICLQLIEELCGTLPESAVDLDLPSVLVAETIGPQQLLGLDRRWLKALILEQSATTSHAAILARSLGIPTLVGVRNARQLLTPGCEVLVDANRGIVIPELSSVVRRFYERDHEMFERRKRASASRALSLGITPTRTLEVGANASSGEEVNTAFENEAEGIGLFRTEMIYLGRQEPPSEEEQFAIYAQAVRSAKGKPVIIRSFDIGGDKKVPYLSLPEEDNPFLGYRGIRIYDQHSELLQSQLRAILHASVDGPVQIMAPMVASVEEFRQFKVAVSRAAQCLSDKEIPFRSDVKLGIMIEVPSVAFALEKFCEEVDFFSIGTNDLSQYFFAADRTNSGVASSFSVRHPAFLRFLQHLVDRIRSAGKWVGMCGEMAADPRNLPLLAGLGLDELSVPAAEVRELKQKVSELSAEQCSSLLSRALACTEASEVDELLTTQSVGQPAPLLSEDLVLLESTSRTKEEVIQEMVDAFYVHDRTADRDAMEEALWAREAEYSTGLGHAFAIPHCKTDAVTANSICILRLQESIEWDSIQGERVRMVVLLAMRSSDGANSHMQVFSSLARRLDDEDFREHLLKFETPRQITTYLDEQLGLSTPLVPVNTNSSAERN
ncbi:MAG: phosphoenolpyruvate--protein phosphotransferase [Candidatus Sulfotelmatobacter sp.]